MSEHLSRRVFASIVGGGIALSIPAIAVPVMKFPTKDKYDIIIEGHDAVIASAKNKAILKQGSEAHIAHMEIMEKHLSYVNEHFPSYESDRKKIMHFIGYEYGTEYSKDNLIGMSDGMVAIFSFASLIWNKVPHISRSKNFEFFSERLDCVMNHEKRIV